MTTKQLVEIKILLSLFAISSQKNSLILDKLFLIMFLVHFQLTPKKTTRIAYKEFQQKLSIRSISMLVNDCQYLST